LVGSKQVIQRVGVDDRQHGAEDLLLYHRQHGTIEAGGTLVKRLSGEMV
jgi:hypothetical protein